MIIKGRDNFALNLKNKDSLTYLYYIDDIKINDCILEILREYKLDKSVEGIVLWTDRFSGLNCNLYCYKIFGQILFFKPFSKCSYFIDKQIVEESDPLLYVCDVYFDDNQFMLNQDFKFDFENNHYKFEKAEVDNKFLNIYLTKN